MSDSVLVNVENTNHVLNQVPRYDTNGEGHYTTLADFMLRDSSAIHPCSSVIEMVHNVVMMSKGKNIQGGVEGSATDAVMDDDQEGTFLCDLGEVYRQHQKWKRELPFVQPFYAVKCNPDKQLLTLLGKLGTGFDCASKVCFCGLRSGRFALK